MSEDNQGDCSLTIIRSVLQRKVERARRRALRKWSSLFWKKWGFRFVIKGFAYPVFFADLTPVVSRTNPNALEVRP